MVVELNYTNRYEHYELRAQKLFYEFHTIDVFI